MNAPTLPTAPNNIELTAATLRATDKQQHSDLSKHKNAACELHIDPDAVAFVPSNVTFCTHVGWDGSAVIFFSLGVAGAFVYLTIEYTKNMQNRLSPFAWVCIMLAVTYVLLVLRFICSWRSWAEIFTAQQETRKEKGTDTEAKKPSGAIEHVKNLYQNIQVTGKWFLWKLYLCELSESVQQIRNLITIYLCSLPVEWTSFICLLLAVECGNTSYTMMQRNTPMRRGRQLKVDMFVDICCVAFPVSIARFVYRIKIGNSEMFHIVLIPAVSLLLKLDDILEDGLYNRSAKQILMTQRNISFSMKRRKESVFDDPLYVKMAKEQDDSAPRCLKLFAAGIKLLCCVFFAAVSVIHISRRPSGCDTKMWGKACINKIPFCKSLFRPTCNCAYLYLVNDFKLNTLPNSMVDEMTGLRRVYVSNCNVTALPSQMELLAEMREFEISFNPLTEFNVDIRAWEKLVDLRLMHNNISHYVESAIWTHPTLGTLDMRKNMEISVPSAGIYMPSLMYLNVVENNMNVSLSFDKESFPALDHLYLNGNNIESFPDISLKDNLRSLAVARCDLNSLPEYLAEFQALKYLDARDNNILMVHGSLRNVISEQKIQAYFSGNVVCSAGDTTLDCKPLCSKFCWKRGAENDGVCDIGCNSRECGYDNGKCKN